MLLNLFREMVETCFKNLVLASSLAYFTLLFAFVTLAIYTTSKQKLISLLITACVIIFYGVSYLLFPENNRYMIPALLRVFTVCVPLLLYLSNLTDWGDFIVQMKKFSIPFFILGGVYIILKFAGVVSEDVDYMQVAYSTLLPVCIMGFIGLFEHNKTYQVLFWVFLVAIFVIGCRGSLLIGILIFLVIFMITFQRGQKKGYIILCLMIALVGMAFFDEITNFAERSLLSVGSESRIIKKIDEGTLFESEGRVLRRTVIMQEVVANDYKPMGLFADRRITDSYLGFETYVHNIFLEFIVDFGIVGIAVAIALLAWMIVVLKKSDKLQRLIIAFFSTYALTKLSISMSYLQETTFYCMLGVLVAGGLSIKNSRVKTLRLIKSNSLGHK